MLFVICIVIVKLELWFLWYRRIGGGLQSWATIGTSSGLTAGAPYIKKVSIDTVLNEGAIFFEGSPEDAIKNEKIKKFYLGSNFSI